MTTPGSTPVVRTVPELRATVARERSALRRIALVPTMGALHEGHLSLIRQAKSECDFVVMSLFVNPTQFNEKRDLDAYPRNEANDVRIASAAGCDLVFAPSADEMYPPGFGTTIDVGQIALPLEGEARGPIHFRGVATVVAKLFNMVAPDLAYFGQKDAQQTLVIRRLVRDLDLPVHVRVCPTVREADGLAMSSRNVRLTPQARKQALGINAALHIVLHDVRHGERGASALTARGMQTLAAHGIDAAHVDYLAIADLETLAPVEFVTGPVLVAIAAHVGGVRLIDNLIVQP
jgi:pantoate--beta-alanine ligase